MAITTWPRRACEGSLRALGVERIDLYQFHAPDPRVPFEESVGVFAELLWEGKVAAVGLSNVSLEQIRAAGAVVPITSVQNRYSPWDRSSEETGIIRYCDENRITFLPYSPVGGRRKVQLLRENAALQRIGQRHGATPEELVLAWVLGASPSIVAIPGATKPETIESSVRAASIHLDGETRAELEAAFRSLPD
ncbi:MAG TPA: aldo/keto reductase [Longimicrobiaceae bacterium]